MKLWRKNRQAWIDGLSANSFVVGIHEDVTSNNTFTNPKQALLFAIDHELPITFNGREILSTDVIRAIGNAHFFNHNSKPFIQALEILREERKFKHLS